MINTSDFSERLNDIMAYYSLSASAFAELIHVQRSSISHVLSGRNKPSLDFILKLNAAFPDINLYWLLNNTGDMINSTPTTTPSVEKNLKQDPIGKTQTSDHNAEHISKQVDRIVIFFKDGTFENYDPNTPK
jgi:plasmid maintenance system antidote protein VapI